MDLFNEAPQLVPTISLWQPWASLIFTGDKRHETRAYPPPAKHVGKRIGIHAALKVVAQSDVSLGLSLLCEREFGTASLPRGALLGTVLLVNAVPTNDLQPTITNRVCGDWRPGRWAWELAELQQLFRPVPYKGKQGWFMVDAELFAPPPALGPKPVNTGRLRDSFSVA